ncbi:MAG TPA: sugar phosphate isomerase/epimerase [Chitinophagaceae bacterium]|jgi:sugar phosphate isomerase/epimerase|nr:sugar phosphate isomerase/epimerase [Chitinophagaceae bacterium]
MTHGRRQFLHTASCLVGSTLFSRLPALARACMPGPDTRLCAHLWVYASNYPPDWDATPVLDTVFSDLSYAGYYGVELMEPVLRHEGAVARLQALQKKYGLRVSGTSYNGQMWNRTRHDEILQDIVLVTGRLQQVGGTTFGISVGDAGRKKTEEELDAQADCLKEVLRICSGRGIQPNLHNHTYELRDGMHDLNGTLSRVPGLKLGPDLNWLVRGGVDPVSFLDQYGDRIVYLHLRDQHADGKWTEALGEGVTDFRAIAAALQRIHFNGWAAVELAYDAPVTRPVRENWKRSREYTRSVFRF